MLTDCWRKAKLGTELSALWSPCVFVHGALKIRLGGRYHSLVPSQWPITATEQYVWNPLSMVTTAMETNALWTADSYLN